MKQKLLVLSIGILLILTFMPIPAMAFWPFEWLGGQVKGVTTTETSSSTGNSGFFDVIRAYMSKVIGTTVPVTMTYPSTGTPSGTPRMYPSSYPSPYPSLHPSPYPSPYTHMTLPSVTPTGTDYKALIDKAVGAGKITRDQGTEMFNQMMAIREKQQELTQLQTSFAQWMKANNITTAIFANESHATPSLSPRPSEPPHATTIRPTYVPYTTGTQK